MLAPLPLGVMVRGVRSIGAESEAVAINLNTPVQHEFGAAVNGLINRVFARPLLRAYICSLSGVALS
jgi:citrate lyase gamma subunit